MPAVKKPKLQKMPKPAAASKASEQSKAVVSGQLKKKLSQEKPKPAVRKERGVVFIKHLPHGFFEQQLSQYFKQFGNVTRVRLARSKRTGGSKGYAFVEFEYPEVAKVAADTMDNYLMFQKVVKAKYIPPDEQKFNYFRNTVKRVTNKAGKDIYVSDITKATQKSVNTQNNWNDSNSQKRIVAGIQKLKKLQKKYKHLGIDFSDLAVQPARKSGEKAAVAKTSTAAPAESSVKVNKQKKAPQLEDLLGNTLNEDSDDEDYVDESEDDSEEEQQSSDDSDNVDEEPNENALQLEDLLGNTLNEDSDDEDYVDDSEDDSEEEQMDSDNSDSVDDDESEEEPLPLPAGKKNKGAERLSDRKPDSGRVQKKKKPVATGRVEEKAAKKKLQLAAAKQLAKPLHKIGKKLKK